MNKVGALQLHLVSYTRVTGTVTVQDWRTSDPAAESVAVMHSHTAVADWPQYGKKPAISSENCVTYLHFAYGSVRLTDVALVGL